MRLLACRLERGLVERVGNVERPDDAQSIDAWLAALAEDLDQDAFPVAIRRGVLHHLDHDLVTWPGPLGAGIADGDWFVERVAIDLDERGRSGLRVCADEDRGGACQDLDNAPLGTGSASAGRTGDLDGDLVT